MKQISFSLLIAAAVSLSATTAHAACNITISASTSAADNSIVHTSSKMIHAMTRESVLEKAKDFALADGLIVHRADPATGELVALGTTTNNIHAALYYQINVAEAGSGLSEVVYTFKRAATTIAKDSDIQAYFCEFDKAISAGE